MSDITITLPGLSRPLPGKLPKFGQYQRWASLQASSHEGAGTSLAAGLVGMCMLHVPAFANLWRDAHADPLTFGDAVVDLFLEQGCRLGGDNAFIKALYDEKRRIQALMGEKLQAFVVADDLADFSTAQTGQTTSP